MSAPSTEGASGTSSFTPADIIRAVSTPRVRFDVYSHGIKISRFSGEIRVMVSDWIRVNVAEYVTMHSRRYGRQQKIKRAFIGTNKVRNVYHIHRNQMESMIKHLIRNNIAEHRIEIVTHPMYEPLKCTHQKVDAFEPRENQPAMIDYVLAPPDPKYAPSKVVTLQTGTGKALTLDTLIKVPGGWTTMGQIKLGDTVTAKDGTPTKVTGVYPQGDLQMYRVTFGDGRSVEACAEHLWRVFYVNAPANQRWRVVNTLEVLRLISMPNPRVYVDLIDPEVTAVITLPIDPYVLGLLIGDGHMGNGLLSISTPDQYIVDAVTEKLPGTRLVRNGKYDHVIRPTVERDPNWVIQELTKLNLYGKLANRKFIPDIYFEGSQQQRMALLQGLMDSDGTADKSGSVSYSTCSEELAVNVQHLVRGLGGIARITTKRAWYTYLGIRKEGQLAFKVNIRFKRPKDVFQLPRKQEKVKEVNQYSEELKLRVTSIVPTEVKPAQCISVDHPDRLFVVNDYIVTHNTFVGLYSMRLLQTRIAIILPARYTEQWVKAIEKTYGKDPGSIMTISGLKQLRAAINMVKAGTFTPRVMVISTTTMFMYLKYIEAFGVDEIVPLEPYEFYKFFGVGVRLIDEVHEEIHCNFRQDCYTHVPLTISLSATLEADQDFINRIYHFIWPLGTWGPKFDYNRYIEVESLQYRFAEIGKLRWTNAFGQYSHTELEKTIMKHKRMLANYVDMITDIVDEEYIKVREAGQRMLIFVATKDLATILADHLSTVHRNLLVNRYISEDDFSMLTSADIAVSTLKSAGTAVDIENLRVTLMTTALSTKQGNEQAVGRTRPLKGWPDVTPKFLFLSCLDIDKHRTYEKEKKEKLYGKVLSFLEKRTNFII